MTERIWKRLSRRSSSQSLFKNEENGCEELSDEGEKLEHLTDYSREAELARRYEQKIRQKQREELLRDIPLNYILEQRHSENEIKESTEIQSSEPPNIGFLQSGFQYETTVHKPSDNVSTSKRLEKALSSVTRSLLESIFVGPAKLKSMEEHPRIAWYLRHCIVAVPKTVLGRSPTPSQPEASLLARIISLQFFEASSKENSLFDLIVMPFDTLSTYQVSVAATLEKDITDADLEEFCEGMRRAFDLQSDFLFKFPTLAKETAKKLSEFTFTENDVVEILKRKKTENPFLSTAPSVMYRELYRQKEELKTRVDHLEMQLQNAKLPLGERASLEKQLHQTKQQAEQIQNNITRYDIENPSVNSKTSSSYRSRHHEYSDLFICGGTPYKNTLKKQISEGSGSSLYNEPSPSQLNAVSVPPNHELLSPASPLVAPGLPRNQINLLRLIRSVISYNVESEKSNEASGSTSFTCNMRNSFWDALHSRFSMVQEETVLLTALDTIHDELSNLILEVPINAEYRNENSQQMEQAPSYSQPAGENIIDFSTYFEKRIGTR